MKHRAILKLMLVAVLAGFWLVLAEDARAVQGNHNLSATAPDGQVCIACHAPHKVPNTPLLWNHVLSSNSFAWSDINKTTGGTDLPADLNASPGSSKMCLSCHDGTVAVGAIYSPDITFRASMLNGGDARIGGGGNLKGNHPVGVPYPYGGVANTYNGITTGDLAVESGWAADPVNVKLYYDESVAGPSNRGIECASCHDPHGTPYADNLRDSKTGSALCLNCHQK